MKLFTLPLMLGGLFSFMARAQFASMNSYGSYGSYGSFGEVPTFGASNDNVSCSCARKVQQGDNSDPVCNQRVKEMVNVAIQRSQMGGSSSLNSLINSAGSHGVESNGLMGSPMGFGTP